MAADHGSDDARTANAMRGPGATKVPRVLIFDVNETLSDMSSMGERFAAVGAAQDLAGTWFASVLRDGFALTVTGVNPAFATLGREALRASLTGQVDDVDAAVEHVMSGFTDLDVHPDVVEGVRALQQLGIRLVTLSNGSASVARGLLDRAGIADAFSRLLSVEDAPAWKPAPAAYAYALEVCGTQSPNAMLVAVHPWDLHGAHLAGLRTAWVNRRRSVYPSSFGTPELEVTSLIDLAARLGGDTGP